MSGEFPLDPTPSDAKPRPVWLQVAIGLLMGTVALIALTIVLGRLA